MDTNTSEFTEQDTPITEGEAAPNACDSANGAGVTPTEAAITALQAEVEDLRLRAEEAEKRLLYANAEFQNISRRKDEQYQAT